MSFVACWQLNRNKQFGTCNTTTKQESTELAVVLQNWCEVMESKTHATTSYVNTPWHLTEASCRLSHTWSLTRLWGHSNNVCSIPEQFKSIMSIGKFPSVKLPDTAIAPVKDNVHTWCTFAPKLFWSYWNGVREYTTEHIENAWEIQILHENDSSRDCICLWFNMCSSYRL